MAKSGRKPLPIEDKKRVPVTGYFTEKKVQEMEEKVKKFWPQVLNWKNPLVQEAVPYYINQKMRDLGRER